MFESSEDESEEVEHPCADFEKSKVIDEKENQLPGGTQSDDEKSKVIDKKENQLPQKKKKRKLINPNVSDYTLEHGALNHHKIGCFLEIYNDVCTVTAYNSRTTVAVVTY